MVLVIVVVFGFGLEYCFVGCWMIGLWVGSGFSVFDSWLGFCMFDWCWDYWFGLN